MQKLLKLAILDIGAKGQGYSTPVLHSTLLVVVAVGYTNITNNVCCIELMIKVFTY